MTVKWSPKATGDLRGIYAYLRDELGNPEAARNALRELRAAGEALSTFPMRGKPLDALIGVPTPYRYLTVRAYRLCYRAEEENVYVVRVLHFRQELVSALWNEKA